MNNRIYKGIVIALSLPIVFGFCRLEGDIDALRKITGENTEENPEENPGDNSNDDDTDDNSGTSIPAPSAPVVTASDSMITVRWTAVEGAQSYEVYLDTTQNPPAEPARTVTTTTVLFDGLVNKTVYYVWIKAVNENATSDFSPYTRGIPWPANEAPNTPDRPEIIPGINQLTVTWEQPGGATSYEVYFSTTPSTPSAPSVTTDRASAVIANLENDVIYYIWVRAVNSAGKSGYSPVEAGTPRIPTVAPAAPARPTLIAGSRELAVSWDAVELTESYEVWLGTLDNSAQAQKYGGDISNRLTETTIIGLINETTYYVWIKAKNVVGASGFSPSASGTPSALIFLPETPSTPLVFWGNRELSVSWQAAEGALFYEMWVGTANNSAQATKYGADVSDTSVTITGLNNGTMYYIWIKAKNNVGTSGFSPMASGKPQALGTPDAPNVTPGLYRGAEKIGNQNLSDSLSYISANAVTGDEFYIILGANESVSPANLNYSGKTVGITLMGYGSDRTITLASDGSMFTLRSGVTLILEENITLSGRNTNNASLVTINFGTFTMNGGTISGNNAGTSGGGVHVNGGDFTMNNGSINGNTVSGSGGGVYVSNGTFTMNDGVISGNTGGGVSTISVGTFTMNGGIISENTLYGVSINTSFNSSQDRIFTMNGGIISKNSLGGVYLSSSSTFIMNSGVISGNTGRSGISSGGNFTMYGGTISGNSSSGVEIAPTGGFFKKLPIGGGQNSCIIYGSEAVGNDADGIPLRNGNYSIYFNQQRRSTTAWETDHIDTTTGMGLSANGEPPYGQ